MNSRGFDLTGKTYNGLKVVERVGSTKSGDKLWSYVCVCGDTARATSSSLKNKRVKSCGCLKNKLISKANTKHGDKGISLYNVLCAMKGRCTNPNNHKYNRYGARGIKVCEEWQDYVNFRGWAYANGYEEGLTIDRIDNDGDYEPLNCRWVTNKVQSRNRSDNRFIEYGGVNLILSDWSELTGLGHKTISYRLNRGWSVEKALTKRTNSVKTPTPEELMNHTKIK